MPLSLEGNAQGSGRRGPNEAVDAAAALTKLKNEIVALAPTRFDVWFVSALAGFLGRSRLFDIGVQSAAHHGILGGFWYAAALFVLWLHAAKNREEKMRLRIITTMMGCLSAILLILLASALIQWAPPILDPALSRLYPNTIYAVSDPNSFPSHSTTVYTAVTAGVYSLDKLKGTLLWAGIIFLIGLPRIYVGGHYPTDVLAGFVLGLAGYAFARYLLEPGLLPRIELAAQASPRLSALEEFVVFVWILEVALEFRDAVWVRNIVNYFISH